MQAVRESYGDISLMRERGLSWADISELLAKLGITARDNQPISPVTLRSAFFLVGNESRDEGAEDASDAAPVLSDRVSAALREAALSAGSAAASAEQPTPAATDPVDPVEASPVVAPPAEPAVARQSEAPNLEPLPEVAATAEATAVENGSADAAPADSVAAESALTESAPTAALPAAAPVDPEEPPATMEAADTVTDRAETAPPAAEVPPAPASDAVPEGAALTRGAEAEHILAAEPDTDSIPETDSLTADPSVLDSTTNRLWKGDRMLGTIFVLNDRGGVGKTLLSHHLMATAMLEGLQLKVVEYEVNERLARLFGPEVVEHRRITQDFMNMMGSGDGFYEFWDQIGPELQRGGRLFDFGGNISQWFFNWAEVSGFDYYVNEGERLTFMVPVTVDLASLSTGMATLERVASIAPKAKRVLVENGFSGPFSQLEDSQYARRKAEMVEREGLHVISMPPCAAPAWARLTGHRLDQVALMTREDLVKLGMTPPVASRSLIIIHEWLRNMRQALSPYLRDAFNQAPGSAAKSGIRQNG